MNQLPLLLAAVAWALLEIENTGENVVNHAENATERQQAQLKHNAKETIDYTRSQFEGSVGNLKNELGDALSLFWPATLMRLLSIGLAIFYVDMAYPSIHALGRGDLQGLARQLFTLGTILGLATYLTYGIVVPIWFDRKTKRIIEHSSARRLMWMINISLRGKTILFMMCLVLGVIAKTRVFVESTAGPNPPYSGNLFVLASVAIFPIVLMIVSYTVFIRSSTASNNPLLRPWTKKAVRLAKDPSSLAPILEKIQSWPCRDSHIGDQLLKIASALIDTEAQALFRKLAAINNDFIPEVHVNEKQDLAGLNEALLRVIATEHSISRDKFDDLILRLQNIEKEMSRRSGGSRKAA